MNRTTPLRRKTSLRAKAARKKQRSPSACAWSARCRTHAPVIVEPERRYCRTHAFAVADKLVGDWVKARDRRCLNCGRIDDLEWAHVHSRGMRFIRYDSDNAVALCRACHFMFTRSPARWAVFVETRFPGRLSKLAQVEAAAERSAASVDIAEIIRAYEGEVP